MIGINAFTKKMTVVPLMKKDAAHLTAALLETIKNQGVTPKAFYTDEEGGLKSTELINFFQDKGIFFFFTRTHAGAAERGIRTFRDMLFKRIRASKEPNAQWHDFIYPVTLTYNMRKENSVTEMAPNEAEKKEKNRPEVLGDLYLKAKRDRKYPPQGLSKT